MIKKMVLLTLFSIPAVADDVGFNQGNHIVVHLASRHSSDKEFNEANPGLSVRHGIDSLGVFVVGGVYRNSFENTSVYAGVGKTFFSVGPVAFTLISGVATGYIERLTPALIPEVSFHYKHISFLVGYIPLYKNAITTPVFTFSLSACF